MRMRSAARVATALALCLLASAQDTATHSATNAAYKYLAAAQTAQQATEQRFARLMPSHSSHTHASLRLAAAEASLQLNHAQHESLVAAASEAAGELNYQASGSRTFSMRVPAMLMYAPIAQELAAIQQRSLAQMKQQSRLEALELARDTFEHEADQLYAPLFPSTTSDDQEARNKRSMREKYEQRKAELEVIRLRAEKELS